MSPTDHTNALPARAECLLARIEAEGGEWIASYSMIAEACGLARSTAQLAVADLVDAGLVDAAARTATGTPYRRTDKVYRPPVPTCTDAVPTRYTDPAESVQADAPERTHAGARAGAQSPLPTPIEPSTATRTEGPLASAREVGTPGVGTPGVGTPGVGTAGVGTVPLGRLAVAAAMESASAEGRTIEAGMRGRIGQAAQRLAEEHSVEVILEAARRLGAGGYADLYTAVRAVTAAAVEIPRAAPLDPAADLMPTGETVKVSPRIAALMRYVRGTWPRASIDAAIWEAELGRVQERFLIEAVRSIARDGDEFAPTWGKVYRRAREIGQPIVAAERSERARLAEAERIAAREATS